MLKIGVLASRRANKGGDRHSHTDTAVQLARKKQGCGWGAAFFRGSTGQQNGVSEFAGVWVHGKTKG